MSDFGDAVRAARDARGWTQRDLAQRVGASQRSVSTWEKGVSEPPAATKQIVAQVLHLPPDVVPSGAGSEPSGQPLLAELPFEELSPEDFENFAVSLAGAMYPGHEVYRWGKSGHKQYGFDVSVEHDGRVVVGIQCKRMRKFGPQEVDKAVTAASADVNQALIFLSRVASPDARTALRRHRGWQLWDKNKLSHAVHELPIDRSVPLVDRYFPLLRERFLGVPLPGPWLEPNRCFVRAGRSEQAQHHWPLVGQGEAVDKLVHFVTDSAVPVGLLIGRGGAGKSKVLHELAGRLSATDITVRFLERNPTIDSRAFEQLPEGSLLIVVDNAHDEDIPVGKVVSGVLAARPGAHVLLAMRPDGELRVRGQLREADLDVHRGVLQWDLPELSQLDAESLAREVLGPDRAFAAARLAQATRDCPFLLVTAAMMIRDGDIELARLEGDERLRREILESLVDTLPSGPTEQPDLRAAVLTATAALQPVRTDDPDIRNALAELTGRAFDEVAPHLSAWEDAGVLLRRGQTYRVVPDLLGDALLARAAQHRDTGAPTGYLERAHKASTGQALANLLVNASRVDWQELPTRRGRLVESLWAAVQAEFQAGDAAVRVAVLEVLKKVAFYQPRSTVALIRWGLANLAEPAHIDAGFGLTYAPTDQDVREAAAPALRNAAYDLDVFTEAVDLLWELGRRDTRPTNQHPHHPLRMLGELAEFSPYGVTVYQERLPAIVQRWLRRPQHDGDVCDPLTVLYPLLAVEGRSEIWSAESLTLRPFLINPDTPAVIKLRRSVLDLAFDRLASAEVGPAVAAAETIGTALHGPIGMSGPQAIEDIRNKWTNEFASTLDRLRDAVRSLPLAPVVCVAIRTQLRWQSEHATGAIRQITHQVLDSVPRSAVHEVARALHDGPADPSTDVDDKPTYEDHQRAHEQFLSGCVAAVVDVPDAELAQIIEQQLSDLSSALGHDGWRAAPFLTKAVAARPSLANELCFRVEKLPSSPVATVIAPILAELARISAPGAVEIPQRLLHRGDLGLARAIGHAFGLQRMRPDLLDGEAALLRALVEYPDPEGIVPAAALGAARFLGPEHRGFAVELFTRVPTKAQMPVLNEFMFDFGPSGSLSWTLLAAHDRGVFLSALQDIPSIESFEAAQFLSMLSEIEPNAAIDLLCARIENVETNGHSPKFRALPFSWMVPLRFRNSVDFPDLLRRVREWIAAVPESGLRQYLGADLFNAVAGSFDEQTRQIIEEYLDQTDPQRMKTVAAMLRKAPRSVVWDTEFVHKCLQAADTCGDESLRAVQSALHNALVSGTQWAWSGQPSLHEVEQRDTAAKLADEAVPGTLLEQFYRALSQSAAQWIDRDVPKFDIPADGRNW